MMEKIPYVDKKDVLRWENTLSLVVPKIAVSIDDGILQGGRLLALHLRNSLTAGAVAYALGNVASFFSCYRKAVDRFQWFFDDKFKAQVEHLYIYETSEQVLCAALIIRSPNILELGKQILPFSTGQSDARSDFIALLAALLNGDMVQAGEIAQAWIDLPEILIGINLPHAILAIITGDLDDFLKHVLQATLEYDGYVASEARGTPEAVVFVRGAALLRLFEFVNDTKISKDGLDVRLVPVEE